MHAIKRKERVQQLWKMKKKKKVTKVVFVERKQNKVYRER
jgi:hypothetical protein